MAWRCRTLARPQKLGWVKILVMTYYATDGQLAGGPCGRSCGGFPVRLMGAIPFAPMADVRGGISLT